MRAHILIVEDEALLYKRLKKVLEEVHYSIDQFTPSVEDALARINIKRPDIVLLDIHLEGILTGIDLGKILNEKYHIPFIYVTGFDDDQTFYESLNTKHELFLVKTKPRLNPKEIVRAIQTVLKKKEVNKPQLIKDGIMGLVMYLDKMKFTSNEQITKVPIKYNDIAFFTVKPFVNEEGEQERLKTNYLWFLTKKGDYYFLRSSLSDLLTTLPYFFVRINESYIVNISSDMLKGNINGARLSILNTTLCISDRYKAEVKRRLQSLYE